MGLFIGASILTILELFDYAYEVSLTFLIRVCSRSNSTATCSAARGSICFSEGQKKKAVGEEEKGDMGWLAYFRADGNERSFSITFFTRAALSCSGL